MLLFFVSWLCHLNAIEVDLCIQQLCVLLNKTCFFMVYIRMKLQFSANNDANVYSSNSTVSS